MARLVLIRGLPGSGKSTLAKSMNGFEHFEADMFFYAGGKYLFDSKKIKEAHEWCQSSAFMALNDGFDVVVSNTFTQRWEMKPYIDKAKSLGIEPLIVVCKGEWMNIHGVPPEKIEQMKSRWED